MGVVRPFWPHVNKTRTKGVRGHKCPPYGFSFCALCEYFASFAFGSSRSSAMVRGRASPPGGNRGQIPINLPVSTSQASQSIPITVRNVV